MYIMVQDVAMALTLALAMALTLALAFSSPSRGPNCSASHLINSSPSHGDGPTAAMR